MSFASDDLITRQEHADVIRALASERNELRGLLAETQGSVRLLAEELEAGADPKDIASRMHAGADYMKAELGL